MAIEVLRCPNCAAPLPLGARGEIVCEYCRHALTGVPTAAGLRWQVGEERPPDDGLSRVHVDGRTYAVLGRLASGDGSEVFLARRDKRLTEMVVIKALRARADADLLAREWSTLQALQQSEAQGWEFFRRMVPQPVAFGRLEGRDAPSGHALVYRWRSGFLHTFEDVARHYERGVDPRAVVWMYKRALELLGWVHRSGRVHGALVPAHLLVHPRDHGVTVVGWGASVSASSPRVPAVLAHQRAYYPDALWTSRQASAATDLTMLARCVLRLLDGNLATRTLPSTVPDVIATLVADEAAGSGEDDAWALVERVSAAGRAAYGPPRYVPFTMPGWK